MKFRVASAEDYEIIINLWIKAGLSYRPNGRDSYEKIIKEITRDVSYFIIAEENGKDIAVVLASHDGRKGWINRLAVDPDYQRKGMALKMIEEAEMVLKEAGIEIYTCLIEDWNIASIELFQKAGYKKHEDIIYFSKRGREDI